MSYRVVVVWLCWDCVHDLQSFVLLVQVKCREEIGQQTEDVDNMKLVSRAGLQRRVKESILKTIHQIQVRNDKGFQVNYETSLERYVLFNTNILHRFKSSLVIHCT